MPRFQTQETGKMQITVDREDLAQWERVKQRARTLKIRIDVSGDFTQWLRSVIRKADQYLEEEEKRRREETKGRAKDAELPSA